MVSKVRSYEQENENLEMGADIVVISPEKMNEETNRNAEREKIQLGV